MYICLESEATNHYILRCNIYSIRRLQLLKNVCILYPFLKNYSNEKLLNILLYGSQNVNCNINEEILKLTITFLKRSKRFNGPFLTNPKNVYPNGISYIVFNFR